MDLCYMLMYFSRDDLLQLSFDCNYSAIHLRFAWMQIGTGFSSERGLKNLYSSIPIRVYPCPLVAVQLLRFFVMQPFSATGFLVKRLSSYV